MLEPIACGEFTYLLDSDNRGRLARILRSGEPYEGKLVNLFERIVRPGDIVFDVGANFGYFTVRLSRLTGPGGRVVAFEPEPGNVALLRQNLEANGCHNVTIITKAVTDRVGTATFYIDDKSPAVHSLARENLLAEGGAVIVETTTLDASASDLGLSPRVLKLDAQGAEGRIFMGADRILSRPGVLLTLEFWPHGLRSMGSVPESVLETLNGHGLQVGFLSQKRGFRPAKDGEIAAKLLDREHGKYSSTNVVAWKADVTPA